MMVAGSREATKKMSSGHFAVRAWNEPALRPAEIKSAKRLVDEHRPARSADEPRNRHAPAVCGQAITALAAEHAIGGSSAVELRPAFAQSEQGRVPVKKVRVPVSESTANCWIFFPLHPRC